jgi:type IV fimbrial biogenesis protein FimT
MKKYMRGFTLIELMVVVAIAAILIALAAPSMLDTVRRNGVQSHLRDLGGGVTLTRSEAVSRGEAVVLCGSANFVSCNNSSDWSSGFLVFVDDGAGSGTAGDSQRNGSEEILKVYRYDGGNILNVVDSAGAAMTAIGFEARGEVVQGDRATLWVCDEDRQPKFARALLLERTGRIIQSFDLHDSSGNVASDGIYEDANGDNLTCT